MDFQIGKYYRTRDGRKTKCINIGRRAGWAAFDQSSPVWLANGFFGADPHPDDIVAEWVDTLGPNDPFEFTDVFTLNPPTSDTVYRAGDVVFVRGVMEINPHEHDKPTRINFGAGINCTPHFNSVKVVHHEPAPRPFKVGDKVKHESNKSLYSIMAIDDEVAWLKNVETGTHATSNLSFLTHAD